MVIASRLVGAMNDVFSGRGTFTQWVFVGLFVAASLVLMVALTFRSLLSLSHYFGASQ
jgi:hypothetical protein